MERKRRLKKFIVFLLCFCIISNLSIEQAVAFKDVGTVSKETVTEPETQPETESETVPETELETQPETESETQPETESETQPETEAETVPETEPETVPETVPETIPETEPETVPAVKPLIKPMALAVTQPTYTITLDYGKVQVDTGVEVDFNTILHGRPESIAVEQGKNIGSITNEYEKLPTLHNRGEHIQGIDQYIYFVFKGWRTEDGKLYTGYKIPGYIPQGDETLTAEWGKIHTLTFVDGDASSIKEIKLSDGYSMQRIYSQIPHYGHHEALFRGWEVTSEEDSFGTFYSRTGIKNHVPKCDETFRPVYDSYTITYDYDGVIIPEYEYIDRVQIKPGRYLNGSSVIPWIGRKIYQRGDENVVLRGWDVNGVFIPDEEIHRHKPVSDENIKLIWSSDICTVTLDYGPYTYEGENQVQFHCANGNKLRGYSEVKPTEENGYRMIKAYKLQDGREVDSIYNYVPSGNETIEAIWTEPHKGYYTIKFDYNGADDQEGNTEYTDYLLPGDNIGYVPYLNDTSMPDKLLIGWKDTSGKIWYDDDDDVTQDLIYDFVPTKNETLTAVWKDYYLITFNAGTKVAYASIRPGYRLGGSNFEEPYFENVLGWIAPDKTFLYQEDLYEYRPQGDCSFNAVMNDTGFELYEDGGYDSTCQETGLKECFTGFDNQDNEVFYIIRNGVLTEISEKEAVIPLKKHKAKKQWNFDSENHWHECEYECWVPLNMAKHDLVEKPMPDGPPVYVCKTCGYEFSKETSGERYQVPQKFVTDPIVSEFRVDPSTSYENQRAVDKVSVALKESAAGAGARPLISLTDINNAIEKEYIAFSDTELKNILGTKYSEGDNLKVILNYYLDVKAGKCVIGENPADSYMDIVINPDANMIVTTAGMNEEMTDQNTVSERYYEGFRIWNELEMNIPLPDGFANAGDKLYVEQVGYKNKIETYPGNVIEDKGQLYVNFKNTNGTRFADNYTVTAKQSGSGGDVPPTGHELVHHAAKAATCTEAGNVEYWSCAQCGKNYADAQETKELTDVTIPALGHELVHHPAKDATCAEAGNVEYWSCTRCGKNFSDAEESQELAEIEIPALGHNMVHHEKVEATCTAAGTKEYWSCERCNKKYADAEGNAEVTDIVIPALGHNMVHHERVEATCTAAGTKEYWHCDRCDKNYADADGNTELTNLVIPALGHNMVHHEKVEATCTTAGTKEYWHCNNCNKNYADVDGNTELTDLVIPATGHDMVHHEKVKATCTTTGTKEYWHCDRCDKNYADAEGKTELTDLVIPALGHDFGNEWKQDGTNHWHQCSRCKGIFDQEKHTFESTITKQPSSTEEGTRKSTCSVCGYSYEESIPKLEVTQKESNVTDYVAPEGADEAQKAEIAELNNAVKQAASSDSSKNQLVNSNNLKALADKQAKQDVKTVQENKNTLEKNDIANVDETKIRVVVDYYMDIKLINVTKQEDATKNELTIDVTPKSQITITTAATNEAIKLDGTDKNAVKQDATNITVTDTVEMNIPLPTGFANVGDRLFVEHKKSDGKVYHYTGTVVASGNQLFLNFMNPHGFSEFKVKADGPAITVNGVKYDTLQAAVDAVADNAVITFNKDCALNATVNKAVTFRIQTTGGAKFTGVITAGSGYELTRNGDQYTVTEKTVTPSRPEGTGSHSSYHPVKPANKTPYVSLPMGHNGPTKVIGNVTVPAYTAEGTWELVGDGMWKFHNNDGSQNVLTWVYAYNNYANLANGQEAASWFRFDGNGIMMTGWFKDENGDWFYLNPFSDNTRGSMLTGWVWIPDANGVLKCYYFNPISDGNRGRMSHDGVADGYTVNANGEWTVDGVVQTR